MRFLEVFVQAFDSIRANKLRSSLTLLAISVGVFAIISANTAVLVLDTYFKDTLSLMGGDVITVSKYPAINMGNDWEIYRNRQDVTFRQMEELDERTRIAERVGPNTSFTTTHISYEDRETEPNVSVRGSNEHYLSNNAFDIAEGRNFQPEDLDYARPLAIIGADIANTLFPVENPVGRTIRVDGRPYTVIGVTKARGNVFGQSLDRFVLMPYTTLMRVYGRDRNISIQVQARSIAVLEEAIDELTGVMRTIRKVAPGDANDFEIETNESLSGVFEQFTGILYLVGFVVGGIALLGAGIGVMNIMLVSVSERTREIGVRKAVGATKKAITFQFLLESIAICQIGGVIGILFGILIGNAAALWLESSIVFPWGAALGGVLIMTVVGVLFGVYPAFKASQLDPIDSLRYE
ncbi:MAG: ABC transporter permease [Balneolaceae bacterium]